MSFNEIVLSIENPETEESRKIQGKKQNNTAQKKNKRSGKTSVGEIIKTHLTSTTRTTQQTLTKQTKQTNQTNKTKQTKQTNKTNKQKTEPFVTLHPSRTENNNPNPNFMAVLLCEKCTDIRYPARRERNKNSVGWRNNAQL